MNTTALAVIQGDELDTIQRTAKLLAASGYFGTANDGIVGMAQVAAKILAGRELGFGPFAAVNGIHIIQGKPTVGANLMAAAVRSHPRYDYRVKELTDTVCALEFLDNGKVAGVSRFTLEDAKTAELSTGKNSVTWKKFPRNMLFARAMSNGVRFYAPDIFSGNAVYVPEELDVAVDGDGNVVDATFTVTPQQPVAAPQGKQDAKATDAPHSPSGTPTEADGTPPHQRMWGMGQSVFGLDWDMARPWVIEKWTEKVTGNTRTSASDLSDDERDQLADYIKAQAAALQKIWPDQKKVIERRNMKVAA